MEQLSSCGVMGGDAWANPDSWIGHQLKWVSGLSPLWFSITLRLNRNKCKCNSGKKSCHFRADHCPPPRVLLTVWCCKYTKVCCSVKWGKELRKRDANNQENPQRGGSFHIFITLHLQPPAVTEKSQSLMSVTSRFLCDSYTSSPGLCRFQHIFIHCALNRYHSTFVKNLGIYWPLAVAGAA